MSWAIATILGVGHLRPAPGTWGSLAAFPLAWGLHILGGWQLLLLATCGLFAIGLWATRVQTEGTDNHDPSEIVVDEVVGQWISLLPVSIGASMMSTSVLVLWPGLIAAFIAFRLFDIWKPDNPIDGRYVWLPLQFEDGKIIVKWQNQWDMSFFDR